MRGRPVVPRPVLVSALSLAVLLAGCGGDDGAPRPSSAFDRFVAATEPGRWRANQDDVVEVWVCHVPADTTSPVYGDLPLRVPLADATLAALFQQQVSRYFNTISNRAYTPSFVAGGELDLGAADGPDQCAQQALDRSSDAATVVLAVADAEHVQGEHGGQGSGGEPVEAGAPASVSRRVAYVGASDFNRLTWGDQPPLDLVEHELGHTLGWVHSGIDATGAYLSALDVMSNSAAPREADPTRRDAPDTIGVQRVIAGWIEAAEVVQADDRAEVVLASSTGPAVRDATRLLVLPVGSTAFLTVEVLEAAGHHDHLPAGGVAVHRVELGAGGLPTAVDPVVGAAPFVDLLQPGDSLEADGWTITSTTTDGVVAERTVAG